MGKACKRDQAECVGLKQETLDVLETRHAVAIRDVTHAPRCEFENGRRYGRIPSDLVKAEKGAQMQQRKMIDIPIGTEVSTAMRAPIDGDYEFVQHIASSTCKSAAKDSKVYKFRGELLPLCPRCQKRAIWKLADYKFEISPERDHTAFVLKEVRGDRPDVAYPSGTKRAG